MWDIVQALRELHCRAAYLRKYLVLSENWRNWAPHPCQGPMMEGCDPALKGPNFTGNRGSEKRIERRSKKGLQGLVVGRKYAFTSGAEAVLVGRTDLGSGASGGREDRKT